MKVAFEVTFGDLLTIVTILITLGFYLHSRNAEKKLQRAGFIRDHTLQFLEYPQLASMFMEIDYSKFKFSEEILGTDKETHLVQLLDVLNSLGFNYANGIIDLKDIDETTLGYAIVRVYQNPEVRKYLNHVSQHDMKDVGLNVSAFGHFRKLAMALIERWS